MKDEEVDRWKGGETGGYKQHSSFVGWLAEPVHWKKRRRRKTKKLWKEDKEEEIRAKNTDRKRKKEMMRRGNIPCGWGLVRRAGSGGDNSLNWKKNPQ